MRVVFEQRATPVVTTVEPFPDELNREIDAITFGLTEEGAQSATLPEFKRLVVAVDGSEESDAAVQWAARLAKAFDARVNLVTVTEFVPEYGDGIQGVGWPTSTELQAIEREDREKALADAHATLADAGVDAERTLLGGSAVARIVEHAEAERADLVVVGSRGHTAFERFMLGSVADAVKNRSHASVLLVRSAGPPSHVLVAVDGSALSRRAAAAGLTAARALDADATILHVVEPPVHRVPGPAFEKAREEISRANAVHLHGTPVTFKVDVGSPAERIAVTAEDLHAGLVVVGSRGFGALTGILVGSVSRRVAHAADANVLVVKPARD